MNNSIANILKMIIWLIAGLITCYNWTGYFWGLMNEANTSFMASLYIFPLVLSLLPIGYSIYFMILISEDIYKKFYKYDIIKKKRVKK